MRRIAVCVAAALALSACLDEPFATYTAEVGYREGDNIRWEHWGNFKSLDACRDAAIARYNFYRQQNEPAYDWSCLKNNNSGGYASRH